MPEGKLAGAYREKFRLPESEQPVETEIRDVPEVFRNPPEEYVEMLEAKGFVEEAKTYATTLKIIEALGAAGGKALLIGGSVRDMTIGYVPKDFDVEVYGLTPDQIAEVLEPFGKISEVGKAFGILKLAAGDGIDIDVSLPRRESKIAAGHKGFAIDADPHMSIKEAARRRDFTFNAVGYDPLTRELHNPFGGLQDIQRRILRITDEERFKDDPLRVLRALQFIARFGLSVDRESISVLQEMIPHLKELPKERMLEEWKKLLLKSSQPSRGLTAGMALGVFSELHPVFPPMQETAQDPELHTEGDGWTHTLLAVDEAARISRREKIKGDEAWVLMLATLCHDLGLPKATKVVDGKITYEGHEVEGEKATGIFLQSMMGEQNRDIKAKVLKLVREHMAPTRMYVSENVRGESVTDGDIRKLAKRIHPATIAELVNVAEADHRGRGVGLDPEIPEQLLLPMDGYPARNWLLERARAIGVEKSKPADLIQGRELLALGAKPGPQIGKILGIANDLRDDLGWTREMVMSAIYTARDGEKINLDIVMQTLQKILSQKE